MLALSGIVAGNLCCVAVSAVLSGDGRMLALSGIVAGILTCSKSRAVQPVPIYLNRCSLT
jgi:hypothetical protein